MSNQLINALPDWVKSEQEVERYKILHSAEHIFNQAVLELWPDKILRAVAHIDPNRFANDAQWERKLEPEDLVKIEAKMQEIIDRKLPFKQEIVTAERAKEIFKGNKFKLEWIDQFASAGEEISLYWTGDEFVDLCKGPHLSNTSEVKAYKLLSISGAYWRGDENNEMLTRVYGTAFPSQKELDAYIAQLEEAKLRDHRKLGKELGLFVFSDLVGQGLPLWTERGAAIRREVERMIVDEEIKRGYQHVYTPDIAKIELYETSGHYPYYKESMYAPIEIDEERFMLRPMTCPHHFELYSSQKRSYRELPMRIAELAKLYRYEKSGELSGLIRVRSFCLADSHIVTPKELAMQEASDALRLIEDMAQILGFTPNKDFWYRLSLGNRSDDKKYYKDDAAWDEAESSLREMLNRHIQQSQGEKINVVEAEDEAAFYGPKVDVQMRNVNGKEDTAFTVQYDFVMPKRFKLKFTNNQGQDEEPVVIHRSSVGAIERLIAFLIEKHAGAFPLWLSPEHVAIIPISEAQVESGKALREELRQLGIRAFLDETSERMQNKIRKAQEMKVPYMVILGQKEIDSGTLSVRTRSGQEIKDITTGDFIKSIKEEIDTRSNTQLLG